MLRLINGKSKYNKNLKKFGREFEVKLLLFKSSNNWKEVVLKSLERKRWESGDWIHLA
jgi:hypothetical protein